jgi:hypothetical protein
MVTDGEKKLRFWNSQKNAAQRRLRGAFAL